MSAPEVSVVIPVSKRSDDLERILDLVEAALKGRPHEVLMVIDGHLPRQLEEARRLADDRDGVRVLTFARMFGEGAALRAGLTATQAPVILTHPAYFQVEASVLPQLLQALDGGVDLAFASRLSEKDSLFNRLQRWAFNAIIRRAVWVRYRDVACGVRAMRREVLEDVSLHGSFHRFLPVLAVMKGLVVREVDAPQHPEARHARLYSPGTYLHRLLDLVNVAFLTRFTYKPLRFFGLIGGALFAVGLVICLYLSALKIFGNAVLAERPLLLLGVLLVAVGFQTLALGLLGELISFSQAARTKPYAVREIVRRKPKPAEGERQEADVAAGEGVEGG
jgi:glycosyltransferase involved in cell wall biosynthesis